MRPRRVVHESGEQERAWEDSSRNRHRLHGPAVERDNGVKVWYWHGVSIGNNSEMTIRFRRNEALVWNRISILERELALLKYELRERKR